MFACDRLFAGEAEAVALGIGTRVASEFDGSVVLCGLPLAAALAVSFGVKERTDCRDVWRAMSVLCALVTPAGLHACAATSSAEEPKDSSDAVDLAPAVSGVSSSSPKESNIYDSIYGA